MEVESMIAHTPSRLAVVLRIGHLVGLTVNAWIHNVVLADGAVVGGDIPSPKGNGIPLFNFKSFLR